MCTLVTLRAPDAAYPVVIAANRDERLDRESLPFGRHWSDLPVRAGKDVLAGGTWAGLHDAGFGVFVLNGPEALGPEPGKRSRGELVVELLRAGSYEAARKVLEGISLRAFRPFHLIVASANGVTGVSTSRKGGEISEPSPGIGMWTAQGEDSDRSARQRAHRERFARLAATWRTGEDLETLLDGLERAMAAPAPEGAPWHAAMCVRNEALGFGTRSSLIVAFGRQGDMRVRVADGPPDRTAYRSKPLD